jgi:hypothetical protein
VDSVSELLAAARDLTGLEDFGEDTFREGLERLVRSMNDEGRLNDIGNIALQVQIVGLLAQRLQIEDWYARHPEIDEEEIVAPLIGLSLPRTGSTALSALLAEDPEARSLLTWEATEPAPPPSTVEGPDPRIARAAAAHEQQLMYQPRMASLVPSSPTGPQECLMLMGLDFKAQTFQAMARIPSYAEWLLYEADLTTTYLYERRVLKLLQWGMPAKPWRLKTPTHLLFLEQLDVAFADARFVMTHRDPSEVIVSVADLYEEVGNLFTDHKDLAYMGAVNVEAWTVGMDRTIAFRELHGDERFYDIEFRAMQKDPVGEVRGLYDWLGEPVTPAFELGMATWWAENSANRTQSVHPEPSRYGIDLDEVAGLFSDYTSRIPAWTNR